MSISGQVDIVITLTRNFILVSAPIFFHARFTIVVRIALITSAVLVSLGYAWYGDSNVSQDRMVQLRLWGAILPFCVGGDTLLFAPIDLLTPECVETVHAHQHSRSHIVHLPVRAAFAVHGYTSLR
jgi:hypothetical protein